MMQPLRPIEEVWPKTYSVPVVAGLLTASAHEGFLQHSQQYTPNKRLTFPSLLTVVWDLPDRPLRLCPFTIFVYDLRSLSYRPFVWLLDGMLPPYAILPTYNASSVLCRRGEN